MNKEPRFRLSRRSGDGLLVAT